MLIPEELGDDRFDDDRDGVPRGDVWCRTSASRDVHKNHATKEIMLKLESVASIGSTNVA